MKPPKDLLNWAAKSAKKRGLRPTMLALASRIAKARGMGLQTHAALADDEALTGIGLEPDATMPVDWIGQVYETLLAAKTRRAHGVHFTPPELAAEVVEATLSPLSGPLRIIDPAMGCGAFLMAAVRVFRARGDNNVAPVLAGFDTDPLAVDLARLSLSIETGLQPESFAGLRVGDALIEASGEFDAVIGNPPFGNAIEKRTARSTGYAVQMRQRFPEFAQGAYDLSLLFFALVERLLAPKGRYGLIGPTALLSDDKPWQRFMHKHFRPSALIQYPMGAFGARVRTVAIVGARGTCESVEVHDETGARAVLPWRDGPWFESAQNSPRVEAARVLGDVAEVFAGCATGAAYELAPLVSERQGPDVAKAMSGKQSPAGTFPLITTGALDRFRCTWGERTIRFLGRDFARPIWPQKGPRAVMAALTRQQRPKILVGGLTSVIEAWLDADATAAGVVSTWVIAPRAGVDLWFVLALLNSATMSRHYFGRFGAKSMSGMQTTIYKRGLLQLPWPEPGAGEAARLGELARALQLAKGAEFEESDRELHRMAARVLGRNETEADEDFAWWRVRAVKRRNPQSGKAPSEC
ncbi:Modification methylase VspI [Planctomycetaceae bacterium]|nr:Modification methylase VspI [Planctomycetaceae bacterium]